MATMRNYLLQLQASQKMHDAMLEKLRQDGYTVTEHNAFDATAEKVEEKGDQKPCPSSLLK